MATQDEIEKQAALSACHYTGQYGPTDIKHTAHSELVNDGIYTKDIIGKKYSIDAADLNDDVIRYINAADLGLARFLQVYQIEGAWLGDDEFLYNSFDLDEGPTHSQITIKPLVYDADAKKVEPVDDAKFSESDKCIEKFADNDKQNIYSLSNPLGVEVSVTPNKTLADAYKYARVYIENKEYSLKILNNPIVFSNFYSKNVKRIKIVWNPNLIETFRIVANR